MNFVHELFMNWVNELFLNWVHELFMNLVLELCLWTVHEQFMNRPFNPQEHSWTQSSWTFMNSSWIVHEQFMNVSPGSLKNVKDADKSFNWIQVFLVFFVDLQLQSWGWTSWFCLSTPLMFLFYWVEACELFDIIINNKNIIIMIK
jgi:hypothetical protein